MSSKAAGVSSHEICVPGDDNGIAAGLALIAHLARHDLFADLGGLESETPEASPFVACQYNLPGRDRHNRTIDAIVDRLVSGSSQLPQGLPEDHVVTPAHVYAAAIPAMFKLAGTAGVSNDCVLAVEGNAQAMVQALGQHATV